MSFGIPAVVAGQQIVQPWWLVTFRATGADLMAALDTTVTLGGDYFPQVSALRFDYDSSAPQGEKIPLDTVHVGGHKLLPEQLYSVTVTEGIYSVLKALRLKMQDIQVFPDRAFDAARSHVVLRGEPELATSNRLRDVAAIPGKGR